MGNWDSEFLAIPDISAPDETCFVLSRWQTDYFHKVLHFGIATLVSGEKGGCSVMVTYVAAHEVHHYQC